MKLKAVICITFMICIVTMSIGLYYKSAYKDLNNEDEPLERFVVGLASEKFLGFYLEILEENLDKSSIIIAAKCEDTFTYRFSCTSQNVLIEHVFKGEGLNKGDRIDIIRGSSLISMDEEGYVNNMPPINMGFTNEMVPGKTYLIFLDRKLNTFDEKTIIYMQSDELILAPIYCYETIENTPCKSIISYGNFSKYKDVKGNEFFLESEDAIEKMVKFKESLLLKYNY